MQFLYQLNAQNGANLEQLEHFLKEFSDDPQTREIARQWIIDTWRNLDQLDTLIIQAAVNWDLSRISHVDRAILRLAVHQLTACPDIPPKVVINEAVEVAKAFSTTQAPAFINGILDTINKKSHQNHQSP